MTNDKGWADDIINEIFMERENLFNVLLPPNEAKLINTICDKNDYGQDDIDVMMDVAKRLFEESAL